MARFFRLLNRLKVPFGLVVLAIGLFATVEFDLIPDAWSPARWDGAAVIAANALLIAAAGWTITTLVDGFIHGRIRKLDLSGTDSFYARKSVTRLDMLRRIWIVFGAVATLGAALTVIPAVRQIGVSLFASAGIAGIAVGIAARPVLSNLIAGLQIAFTQPMRLNDVVIVEGEWGRIEEIDLFYVIVRIWDLRRLVVPLSYFIEQPFENWSRSSTQLIGVVYWSLDYRAPVEAMREKLHEICEADKRWDGDAIGLLVTDSIGENIQVRAIASARDSSDAWELRCHIREQMITWLQDKHPEALPVARSEARIESLPEGFAPFAEAQAGNGAERQKARRG